MRGAAYAMRDAQHLGALPSFVKEVRYYIGISRLSAAPAQCRLEIIDIVSSPDTLMPMVKRFAPRKIG